MADHTPRPTVPNVTRRGFLQTAGVATAAAMLHTSPAKATSSRRGRGQAKNIIFLVSDGMSYGTFGLADIACKVEQNRRSHWSQLFERPETHRAMLDTTSADGHVTDSSAAACAWGCGQLFNNGVMGIAPDGSRPVPILPHAKQSGKFVSVVTTARVTHATPAGFCCNVEGGRGAEREIGAQMLDREVDLILGGGRSSFRDQDALTASGYRVLRHRSELGSIANGANPGKILGIFSNSHLAYEMDRRTDPAIRDEQPSLAELTEAALRIASNSETGSSNGFVMQIEGARVDHAAHGNDAVGLVFDQIAFDDAIQVAMKFADERDDTLVIITTDHGNANPGLAFYGKQGVDSFEKFLYGSKRSYEWIYSQWGAEPNAATIERVVSEATGMTLSATEIELLLAVMAKGSVHPFQPSNSVGGVLADLLANHSGIAFMAPNHTADPVELTAIGPGSEQIKGHMVMPQLHEVMVKALDLPPARPLA